MLYFRSSIFAVIYFCTTVTYGTISVFTWLLPAKIRHRIIVSWTHFIVFLVKVICGVRYQVHGVENILLTKTQPAVVLSKHQSTWETLFLQGSFWPASTILKKELLDIPFFGWGLRGLYPIAIDRSDPKNALRQVKSEGAKRIAEGFNVIIFPEGTRMKLKEKGKYARSGADIACTAGCDVIPVAMNSGICWPADERFRKYPGVIQVIVGEPISTEDKSSKQVTAEAEAWIENQMARLPQEIGE